MKRKILILSLAYYPEHIGGAEVAIKEITDRLSPDKYEFHLVCNRYNSGLLPKEKIGNILVHRIGLIKRNPTMADLRKWPLHLNKIIYQWLAYYKAKKLHREHHFDAIWAMMAHATGVPASKFKKNFPEVKYLLTLQEGDPIEHIERKMRVFGQSFDDSFVKADLIQVISTFLGQWAKEKGFQAEPILIPNGVNTVHFAQKYSVDELRKVRHEFGYTENDIILVTTSRLVHKNALDDVIRAIALLPERVKFVVFGAGPDEEKLKSLSRSLGVSGRLRWQGQVEHTEIVKYLKACDIFIRPSRSEGMGNSFIEAMAAGLPVIASQVGGIVDFLFDARRNPQVQATGWAVAVGSPDQIQQAVLDILNNPDHTREVVARAKAMVSSKYDWNLIASRMDKEVFETLFRD